MIGRLHRPSNGRPPQAIRLVTRFFDGIRRVGTLVAHCDLADLHGRLASTQKHALALRFFRLFLSHSNPPGVAHSTCVSSFATVSAFSSDAIILAQTATAIGLSSGTKRSG